MKETKTIPQFIIAAPTSGAGKTTIATGLMSLLTEKGMAVQPFKCGPDYIDTKFHAAVCRRPSVNLDTFMASAGHVKDLFARYSADADVAIVEGMMGLFDGYDRSRGSAAEVARLLGIPVILAVDAKSTHYSIAPLLYGFREFDPEVNIAGVIFNRVGSNKHRAMLADVCHDVGMTCFGFLPNNKNLEQKARYLGLDYSEVSGSLDELRDGMEQNIDWKLLLEKTMMPLAKGLNPFGNISNGMISGNGNQKILIARNADSFSFIYQEHLDLLERLGEVTFFDPEENRAIPDGIDLIYLPGGYPEKHLEALAAAADKRRSIREYAEAGGRIIAECGGMIYLCQDVITDDGTFPMVGFLDHHITAKNADRKLSLGYRQFNIDKKLFTEIVCGHGDISLCRSQFESDKKLFAEIMYGQRGENAKTDEDKDGDKNMDEEHYIQLRGHEFHYTQFAPPNLPQSAVQVYDARGNAVTTPVIIKGRTIASYTHLYLNT